VYYYSRNYDRQSKFLRQGVKGCKQAMGGGNAINVKNFVST